MTGRDIAMPLLTHSWRTSSSIIYERESRTESPPRSNTLSKCQTPCPCSVGRMWGYGRCQNTVWQKKKALPSPTTLALCPVAASLCRFQPASSLWSCRDIFSLWMPDRQIKTCSPTELLHRLTWSMQSQHWQENRTKMWFIKAQISLPLQKRARWLALIDIIMRAVIVHSSSLAVRKASSQEGSLDLKWKPGAEWRSPCVQFLAVMKCRTSWNWSHLSLQKHVWMIGEELVANELEGSRNAGGIAAENWHVLDSLWGNDVEEAGGVGGGNRVMVPLVSWDIITAQLNDNVGGEASNF